MNAFMSVSDDPKRSTNARQIYTQLHPKHVKAIDRIWSERITDGERLMKTYRDKAGVHGDNPKEFFSAKVELLKNKGQVVRSLDAFFSLSMCLLNRQKEELPELAEQIEGILLDLELQVSWSFNRKWLRKMHLIESGRVTKIFY